MTTRKNLSKITIFSTINILFLLHFYKNTMVFFNISFWLLSIDILIFLQGRMLRTGPNLKNTNFVATPLWGKCEDEIHTPKKWELESSGTPATLELNIRKKNTLPWGVLYTVEKVLKCRCPKWPRLSHLDIYSPSYGQKKGWRPLKVGNRPNSDVCRRNATWRWKALKDSYKIASDFIPIGGLSKKLWMPKVSGVQPGIVSGLLLGSPGKKCHLDVASAE